MVESVVPTFFSASQWFTLAGTPCRAKSRQSTPWTLSLKFLKRQHANAIVDSPGRTHHILFSVHRNFLSHYYQIDFQNARHISSLITITNLIICMVCWLKISTKLEISLISQLLIKNQNLSCWNFNQQFRRKPAIICSKDCLRRFQNLYSTS